MLSGICLKPVWGQFQTTPPSLEGAFCLVLVSPGLSGMEKKMNDPELATLDGLAKGE